MVKIERNEKIPDEDKLDGIFEERNELREMELSSEYDPEPEAPAKKEVVEVENPAEEITKKEWDKVIRQNFPELWPVADVAISAVGQLLLKDAVNPFGLVLVDQASSGKTIILNFLTGIDELIFTEDKFSPASFVSHAANRKRDELSHIDMLPKIKDKVLIVRDLAPMFAQRSDDLQVNMGILTRVFDGEGLEISTGLHGKRGYRGVYMFIFLAASTPIQPQVWKIMSTLGSRLLFVNVGSKEKDEETLLNQITTGSYRKKETECRNATKNLLRTLWRKHPKGIKWDPNLTEKEIMLWIPRMAKFLAKFRGTISIWRENGGSGGVDSLKHSIPQIEFPDRLNQILYNFTRGHAVVRGRNYLTDADIKATMKIMLESVPYIRARLFKHLVNKGGKLQSEEVRRFLNCSKTTALKEMRYLVNLGLVKPLEYGAFDEDFEKAEYFHISIINDFKWLLEAKTKWPELFEL